MFCVGSFEMPLKDARHALFAKSNTQAPTSPAEASALAFADEWMQYAVQQVQEHGTDFPPTVHFLPGE